MNNQGLAPYRRINLFILLIGLMVLPLLLMAFPRTVQAQGACSGSADYGDAPASYLAACATPSATLYIGPVQPDTETASQFSTAANGDDILGSDDESFLNPLTPIDVSNTAFPFLWSVPVTNTTGSAATLAGWIDFNGNGVFDTNERATATVTSGGATVATLTWNIPITASFNITSYVRLRISTNSNVAATNNYGIGEVEDYAVSMLKNAPCDPGTSFYYIQGTSGGNATIQSVNALTGVTAFVNDPPTLTNINGLAIDAAKGLIYFQDAADSTVPDGIYGYNLFTSANFTVTDDAGAAPLNLPLANGWQTASGAYANGRYYAGIDGDDTGRIYEITLNATGTAPVSARLVISPPLYPANCVGSIPPGGTNCRNYGDLIVVGNQMYVALWTNFTTPQSQIFDVFDINSGLLLNQQIISVSGFAFQLGRDGYGQIYAVTSDNGRIYRVTNNLIVGFPTTGLVSTIGAIVTDASECVFTRTPTAVELSSFSARGEMLGDIGRVIAVGVVGGLLLSAALVLIVRRRDRKVAP